MQKRLAAEGVWCEPASAAGAAGLFKEVKEGRMDVRGQTVVCVVTGHGLKDPDVIMSRLAAPKVIPAELEALEKLV
jgi:threonine synthase